MTAPNPPLEPVPLLSVRDLRVTFERAGRAPFAAVDGVSFDVQRGEIVGIVGESGSGKSLTARAILRILPQGGRLSGGICFDGQDVVALEEPALRALRGGRIAMVFQDPMTSFNPLLRIGDQIREALVLHQSERRRAALATRVVALLRRVGIGSPEIRAGAYPHAFSGGMRQRALTAMALANDPVLLIADEPTTALDVTVQDQVMDLLRDLNARNGTAILLITHNIAVVASLCSRVVVMYAGRIVEDGPVEAVLDRPEHPYTASLLLSVPRIKKTAGRLTTIPGQPPEPGARGVGCAFAERCPAATARCAEAEPPLATVAPGRRVSCWHPWPGGRA